MGKTCKLKALTWTRVDSTPGGQDIIPICPRHAGSSVRAGKFGTGIIVVCEVGNHLVHFCNPEQFEAEKEEARQNLEAQP